MNLRTLIALLILLLGGSTSFAEIREAKSADGSLIRYEIQGTGSPALVFIHGWCCNRTFWEPQLAHFAKQRKVVAIDLAGHGESEAARKDYTMASFGQDVAAVVNDLKLDSVILVGHSMGGPVELEAAALLKPQTVGVIVVDAFTDPDEAYTYQQITAYCQPFQDDFPAVMLKALMHEEDFFRQGTDQTLIDRIVGVMTAAPPEMGHSAFLGMLDFANTRQRPLMSQTKVPFLCINAKRDEQKVRDGRKYAPQFEVITLPSSGHFLMMEHPDEFNALLEQKLIELKLID